MKDACAKITDEREIELKSGLAEPARVHGDCGFLIPAGILIGLGAGILADQGFTGFLVGLGLGFLGEGLLPLARKTHEGGCARPEGANVTMLMIGSFLVLVGIGIAWAPAAIWPYAIAGLLILAGTWSLVRGISKIS